MIKEIVKDHLFLAKKSELATKDDLAIVKDLEDTLCANKERCVGMAANMIGYNKRIIIVDNDGKYMVMLNPFIIKKKNLFSTSEGCLSLEGVRKTTRYNRISVEYYTTNFEKRIKSFSGFVAQIIQHEIDHCDGILI